VKSVVDSHLSPAPKSNKPAEAGFLLKMLKLTGQPLSFCEERRGQASFPCARKQKTRRSGFSTENVEADR